MGLPEEMAWLQMMKNQWGQAGPSWFQMPGMESGLGGGMGMGDWGGWIDKNQDVLLGLRKYLMGGFGGQGQVGIGGGFS